MNNEYECSYCCTPHDSEEGAIECCACEDCANKDKRIEHLEATLAAIAKLPDSWRDEAESAEFIGSYLEGEYCADQLEALIKGD